MSESLIGAIGAIAGTIVGSLIAAFISYREQEREPRLLLLEKRIGAYGRLYQKIYEIGECFKRNDHENMVYYINEYKKSVLEELFLLDEVTRGVILELFNYLMQTIGEGGLDPKMLDRLIQKTSRQLMKGIGIKYTQD
ncbi:MAG: hypothetical protein WCP96_04805 [Methylococcaceae bacterium]